MSMDFDLTSRQSEWKWRAKLTAIEVGVSWFSQICWFLLFHRLQRISAIWFLSCYWTCSKSSKIISLKPSTKSILCIKEKRCHSVSKGFAQWQQTLEQLTPLDDILCLVGKHPRSSLHKRCSKFGAI